MDESGVERVRRIGRHGADDENRHDEAVDGDDARHHDGDEGLRSGVSVVPTRSTVLGVGAAADGAPS